MLGEEGAVVEVAVNEANCDAPVLDGLAFGRSDLAFTGDGIRDEVDGIGEVTEAGTIALVLGKGLQADFDGTGCRHWEKGR
jgi:hypothetical protein